MSSRERLEKAATELGWTTRTGPQSLHLIQPGPRPLTVQVYFAQFGGKVRSAHIALPDGRIKDRISGGVPGVIEKMKEMTT